MSLIINTNVSSLNAQNNLTKSGNALSQATERLSSGLKINSSADNAAGYAISTRYTTQIGSLATASTNASDAINLAQTTSSALDQVTSNLQAIRDLATQSANGTYSDSDRATIDTEVQQRLAEVTRIANQTSFNGKKVLDGSLQSQSFQIGANVGQTISVSLGQSVKSADLGQVAEVSTGDISGALKASAAVTPSAATAGTTTGSVNVAATDYSQTGASKSFTVDGNTVNLTADDSATGALATDIQGQLGAAYTVSQDATSGALTIAKTATGAASTAPVIAGTDATALFGTTTSTAGKAEVVAVPASTGSLAGEGLTINGTNVDLSGATSLQDVADTINAANVTGVSAAVSGDGKGVNFYSTTALTIGDTGGKVIGANAKDANTGTTYAADSAAATDGSLASGSVGTVDGANDLISRVDVALKSVSDFSAQLGAVQNRFQSTISTLASQSSNLQSSQSSIQDADFAAETANLSKAQVLQQAGISVLSQANSQPQQILKLLQ